MRSCAALTPRTLLELLRAVPAGRPLPATHAVWTGSGRPLLVGSPNDPLLAAVVEQCGGPQDVVGPVCSHEAGSRFSVRTRGTHIDVGDARPVLIRRDPPRCCAKATQLAGRDLAGLLWAACMLSPAPVLNRPALTGPEVLLDADTLLRAAARVCPDNVHRPGTGAREHRVVVVGGQSWNPGSPDATPLHRCSVELCRVLDLGFAVLDWTGGAAGEPPLLARVDPLPDAALLGGALARCAEAIDGVLRGGRA